MNFITKELIIRLLITLFSIFILSKVNYFLNKSNYADVFIIMFPIIYILILITIVNKVFPIHFPTIGVLYFGVLIFFFYYLGIKDIYFFGTPNLKYELGVKLPNFAIFIILVLDYFTSKK